MVKFSQALEIFASTSWYPSFSVGGASNVYHCISTAGCGYKMAVSVIGPAANSGGLVMPGMLRGGQVITTCDRSKIFAMQIFKIYHSEHLKVGISCDWFSFSCPPLM